ncbi:hypothetical protein [Stutzerimonas stutzeri]|uniref:hypothetical protein n=1 Tax=Stutzerimonas stutzeri TaxID=316 RepID=UPI00244ADE2B|nr:hypothetical protein [Stutzerimonas stutzeri]MDH0156509.1 hypothetical protein [Stutzerimonas stutzeri]
MTQTKLCEDRRRRAPGTHLIREIKVRVCTEDHEELIQASRLAHAENLTGYARDCMFIGHRLQQGGQQEQVLAAMLLQQQAHLLTALFRGEPISQEELSELVFGLAKQSLQLSVGDTKSA